MTANTVSLFTRNLMNNFLTIGEIVPCSRFTAQKIIEYGNISKSKMILEIGPGTGPFTKKILENAPGDAKVVVVEKIADFSELLRKKFPDDRLQVIHADILDEEILNKLEPFSFDTIVSSIPLSPLDIRDRIYFAKLVKKLLKPEGVFVKIQLSLASRKYFERQGLHFTGWTFEIRNILPVFIYKFRHH